MSATPAERWGKARTYHHSRFPADRIAAEREQRISVCLPARECAETVGEMVGALVGLRDRGAIDEVVVVDAASADGTAAIAERAGAVVWQERDLMPAYGEVLGKGDAMWRALSVLDGELVCFLDADTEGFSPHFPAGLLGPLVCEPGVSFVKGFYRRPLGSGKDAPGNGGEGGGRLTGDEGSRLTGDGGGRATGDEGGRVNHLMARPALSLFYEELAEVRQPLAGEVAARRELLEALPFATGYGVEIAMLIDAWRELGLDGLAQVDLEEHRNPHQPLAALTPMAATVLATIAARLCREGRLQGFDGGPVERPPLAGVRGSAPRSRSALGAPSAPVGGLASGSGAASGGGVARGSGAASGGGAASGSRAST